MALLAGIDSLFGYAGATIGSILTPRFRVSKLRVIYVILTTALIIGLGFGIIPMLIRSLVVAVPLLFMVNLIYNIFINAFFTAVMSILISVVPRGEFGIVYSSRGYYSRITDCECRYLGLHRLGHWCAKGLNNCHGNGHNGIPRI
ncbi:hypothetical protein [Vulcanisaeta sp. JCM 16161]|uniref:hypothetical protein n=1 Tax=Vulcanisaeta sp. JCM 16161 TaxID=1295372 RepID=UPI0006D0158E|nr:hypothetical protein [Vulcanisaeta sp. JCM 16161]